MNARAWIAGALLLVAALPVAAAARPVSDCPLRDARFSVASPLIDVLLSPAATAVVDRDAPSLLTRLPPPLAGTTAPSFAAILDLRALVTAIPRMTTGAPYGTDAEIAAVLARLDADLAVLPVTAADRRARCRRYDDDRPDFTLPRGHPRLLLFEKINGFRDGPSVSAAHAAVLALARSAGWGVVATDRGGAISPAVLRRFDAVIWNNVSGDVLTLAERAALRHYVEGGGGFVGVHGAAGDPVTWWDWYVDTLIGARFIGHPTPDQFQTARVTIDDPDDPVARGLPRAWAMTEEWYSFAPDPRASGSHIVATLDERTYHPGSFGGVSLSMGDHPIAWRRCVGRGRMFYSAIGHRPEVYDDPVYRRMLANAIAWSAASARGPCR